MRPMAFLCGALLAGSLLAPAGPAGATGPAPERLLVASTPTCPECRIEVTFDAALGGGEGGEPLCPGPHIIATDGQRRTFLVSTCEPYRFLVFAPDGRLLEVKGTRGQGPGELDTIGHLFVDRAGRLHAFDHQRRRVIFDPELTPIRTLPIRRVPRAVVDGPDGTTVQNIVVPDSESGALPLHVVAEDGSIVRSFGATDEGYRYDQPYWYWRSLAAASSRHVWAAHFNRYEIDLWDVATGRLLKTIVRDADWFPAWKEMQAESPVLTSLRVDSRGYLWVVAIVFDPAAPALPPSSPGEGRRPSIDPADQNRFFDTRIEVVDPASGRLVATSRFDRVFGSWVGDRLGTRSASPSGESRPELWRVRFVDPRAARGSGSG